MKFKILSEQSTVSKSSTESEYRGLAVATVDLAWIQFLYCDLGIPMPTTPILWRDNIGATYLSANPIFHAMTKHVEIDFHFVREKVAHKELDVHFVSSENQIDDVFTKPRSSQRFSLLRDKLIVMINSLT